MTVAAVQKTVRWEVWVGSGGLLHFKRVRRWSDRDGDDVFQLALNPTRVIGVVQKRSDQSVCVVSMEGGAAFEPRLPHELIVTAWNNALRSWMSSDDASKRSSERISSGGATDRDERHTAFRKAVAAALSGRSLALLSAKLGRAEGNLAFWQVTLGDSDNCMWSTRVTMPPGSSPYSDEAIALVVECVVRERPDLWK